MNIFRKINNLFKNTSIVKSYRENNFYGRSEIEIYPETIDFLDEENGWYFYSVTDKIGRQYLCFLSSSDTPLLDEFILETKNTKVWLNISKIKEMENNNIIPFYIQEMNITR